VIKEASPTVASSIKKPLAKIKLVYKKSSKKLHFSPKAEKVVRVQTTRLAAKRLHVGHPYTHIQVVES